MLADGYDGPLRPGRTLLTSAAVDKAAASQTAEQAPPPSPVITAGSNDPKCVN